MSAEMTALAHDVLQPYSGENPADTSDNTKRAIEFLKNAHLIGTARPATPASSVLIEQYSRALTLGTRGTNFITDIIAIHDAMQRGDLKRVRDAIRALWQHAGRTEPDNATLAKMVEELQKIERSGSLMEHATLDQPDHSIEVSWSKPDGKVAVDVVDKNGPDGKPTRTVFEGKAKTRPDAAGKSLETTGSPSPDKPRQVTEGTAKTLREKLNGEWVDQEGLKWDITGNGGAILLTQTYDSGHKVSYVSDYKLATISGTYTVKDPKDMREGLPDEIKQQLASTHHPPYKIRLDVNEAGDRLEGRWVSQHVTYDRLDMSVSNVGNPYDTPLVLTRAQKTGDSKTEASGTALGMNEGDFP